MKVVVLSSGSKGNSTFVEVNNKRFLLDVGRTYKYLKDTLNEIDIDIKTIDYVLITHNHSDHTSGLKQVLKNTHATLVISEGVFASLEDITTYEDILVLEDTIDIDGINIRSIKSSHDAPDARNFIISYKDKSMCYVTDTGYINNKNFKYLTNLNLYLFESNHDIELLQNGPYPPWLKKRVLSDIGHLSNEASSFYLTKLIGPNTKKIVLIHLSETNNLESIALETINNKFIDYNIKFNNIVVAHQNKRTDVIEI